jgi:hypothetical protein
VDYLRQRQTTKRRLYSRTVKILLLLVIVVLARPTWNMYKKSQESGGNLDRAREELAALEAREKTLLAELESIKGDRGMDAEIRAKFGVAREGESVLVIVEGKKEPEPPAPQEEPGVLSRAWSRFLGFFGVD